MRFLKILTVNFIDTWYKLLPVNLRQERHVAWGRVLLFPLVRLFYYFKYYFVNKGNFNFYDDTVVYMPGTFVIDKKNQNLYLVIKQTITSPALKLTDTEYFIKYQDNFLSINQRILSNTQKVIYENILNESFKWPYNPNDVSPHTSIYIDNINMSKNLNFYLGDWLNDDGFAYMELHWMDAQDGYDPDYYYYTIYVPDALWITLGINDAEREKVIRQVANKFNIYYVPYRVVNY